MLLSVIDNLDKIPPRDWNALTDPDNPFVKHEFLSALEHSGSVTAKAGWSPQHLVVHEHARLQGRLLGAAPMYLKTHSYGEYIFDWAWANAYAHARLKYYPKLVVAVPFTPVTGPRLLLAEHPDKNRIVDLLILGARDHAQKIRASSVHWLFTDPADTESLEKRGLMRRMGYQFHWQNRGYRDFDDFLAGFSAQKRKKVNRERRYVKEAGVEMEVLTGDMLREQHWNIFYEFYHSTLYKHGGIAYLTPAFFQELGASLAQNIVLILARHQKKYVAGALNLRGSNTLYGRYWGSLEAFHSLHFETCYYRAIEYCIDQGLQRFEAGAQGEHKLSRGFLPAPVLSAHWLSHSEFYHAIADFLAREKDGVEYYINELNEHSPFKKDSL
jgi:predicted N-acyltransferase